MRIVKNICSFVGMLFLSIVAICMLFPKFIGVYLSDSVSINEDSFVLSWDIPSSLKDASVLSKDDSLIDILLMLKRACSDARVKGLVLKLDNCELPFSTVYEIARSLKSFKKPIYAYGSSVGNSAYLLACHANEIYMHPNGILNLTGIYISSPFMKDLFDKVGVSFHVEKREEYKTYANMYTEKDITVAQKDSLNKIVQDYMGLFFECMSLRKVSQQAASDIIDNGPYASKQALSRKLIDKVACYKQAMSGIQEKCKVTKFVEFSDYLREKVAEKNDKKSIGVICLEGTIVDRKSEYNSSPVISRKGVEKILQAVDAEKYSAFIVRINSPGGSAVASEDVLYELKSFVQKHKVPVLVSMGHYAASGGYWIACGLGQKIMATPYTLTGSIGVIGMMPYVNGLLNKLGVNFAKVESGKNASFGDFVYEMSKSEKAKFAELIDETYENFLSHVSESRKMSMDDVKKIAKGRVWSGAAAFNNHLVDCIGSFSDAVDLLKKEIHENDVNVIIISEQLPVLTMIMYKLQSVSNSMGASLLKNACSRILEVFSAEHPQKYQVIM